ncbi:MAG: homoserine dehydrogenase [Planctomycetes bacterium]|nr:homoserine dehydrogenase [Planctomycetota bacterium]
MASDNTVGVALIGCGTVGSGVARLLINDHDLLASRSGLDVRLRHVVDVDFTRARQVGVDEGLFRKDIDDALKDPRTHVVVELVGGTTLARTFVQRALAARKHVVTANKALLAHHGAELWAMARAHGVCIAFEASCVGGVPVIGALLGGLLANEIDALYGIVNGTCNYILSAMAGRGAAYADVLAQAQADGLAEADPTLDVSGEDSAHKLAILAGLAFGRRIDYGAIHVEGIDTLDIADIRYGAELGYTVKLLAIARRQDDGLSLRVHPAFLHDTHPLAGVNGPFNAVSIFGHAVGHTLFYGRGAGSMPTASAVVSDILSVGLGAATAQFARLGLWPDRAEPARQLPIDQLRGRYYLRLTCQDSPGVLAAVTDVFGRHRISLSGVLQHEPDDGGAGVPVVITTAATLEGNIRAACREIDALPVVTAPTVVVRIVEEHQEKLP